MDRNLNKLNLMLSIQWIMLGNRDRYRPKGPSIKYVTLEGVGGPRRCDSL